MTSLQDIKPEQIDALNKQSQAAFDAQIKRQQEVASAKPALKEVLDQKVHPQSLCGCGCQQTICGFFTFEGCGCGCYPQSETIQISSSLGNIEPQGVGVKFVGQVTGSGTNINISPGVYLQGIVPDAENLIGIPLTLQLSINSGSLILYLFEGPRLLTALVPQYGANISGEFSGSGTGIFNLGL
jgi:hypothetical protein